MRGAFVSAMVLVLTVGCGGATRKADQSADVIDLAGMPQNLTESQWEELLRPLEGRRVSAIGCAMPMSPTRSWRDGYVLWPCEFAAPDAASKAHRSIASSQMLVVYPTLAEPKHRPRTRIRVTGILRLGMVADGVLKWGWGRLEDATWTEDAGK